MRNFAINNVGKTYGRLTVLSVFKHGRFFGANVKCTCGETKTINHIIKITSGQTKSCGCLLAESVAERRKSHGMTKTPLYRAWLAMQTRCYNKKYKMYHRYGERGISVCDEWRADFMSFYKWAVNTGYKPGLSLDRVNNNGNYEPLNCRWATAKQQARNRGNNILVTHNNETKCISEWAETIGLPDYVVLSRHNRGVHPERMLFPEKLVNQHSLTHKI